MSRRLFHCSQPTKPLAVRFGALFSGMLFLATGGFGGFELHPTTHHGPHVADQVAISLGAATEEQGHDHEQMVASDHSDGHEVPEAHEAETGHSHHESGEACTCVGACTGAAVPQLSRVPTQLARAPIEGIRVVGAPAPVVRPTPNAYLPPLPNGPPPLA